MPDVNDPPFSDIVTPWSLPPIESQLRIKVQGRGQSQPPLSSVYAVLNLSCKSSKAIAPVCREQT